jgi:hypothetical protein
MRDQDLEAKFRGLCAPILDEDAIEDIIAACWKFGADTDSGSLARLTVPQKHPVRATA